MYARYATLMLDGPQGRPAVYPFWVVPKMGKVSPDPYDSPTLRTLTFPPHTYDSPTLRTLSFEELSKRCFGASTSQRKTNEQY